MPDGVMQWFDTDAGEGVVVRDARSFRAFVTDVEAVARRPGARVHFDIRREDGIDRAVDVRLRSGSRASHRHHRFGTLQGARRLDTKGSAPFARPHADLGRSLDLHPLEVARVWGEAVASGDVVAAQLLYAPDAVIHEPAGDLSGRRQVAGWLERHPAFRSGRHAETRGRPEEIEVSWSGAHDEPPACIRCRVEHGLIAEQWPVETSPLSAVPGVEPGEPPLYIETVVSGDVDADAITYAHRRIAEVVEHVDEPILYARIKLAHAADPARARPTLAQATLGFSGDAVRSHVASHSMLEAIDLLQRRLRDQIEHRARHREALRSLTARPEEGEWRHGDLPTERPEYFDRLVEERELVRLKTFADEELTVDEAVFDMDQLGYDFYLFRDLASGVDSVVRRVDGSYLLTRLTAVALELGPTAYSVVLSNEATPSLSVSEAIERLNVGGEPFVFFRNVATERGNVCYRRYDGHYGLITPD